MLNRTLLAVSLIFCWITSVAQPAISTNPDSFNVVANTCNDTIYDTLSVYNTGSSDLIYQVFPGVGQTYDSISTQNYDSAGAISNHVFNPAPHFSDSIYLTIRLNGDFDANNEYADLYIDGDFIQQIPDGNVSNGTDIIVTYEFSGAQVSNWLQDGSITVRLENSDQVGTYVGTEVHEAHIEIFGADWVQTSVMQDTTSPGDTTYIPLQFVNTGLDSGTYLSNILLQTNDPNDATYFVPCTFTVNGYPKIGLSEPCLLWDTAFTYVTVKDSFWIHNTGCNPLNVSNITHSLSEFSVAPTTFSVASGDSNLIEVSFYSTNPGTFQDTLQIFNNDRDTLVCLEAVAEGRPELDFMPDTLNFTLNSCCDSATLPLTVYNNGMADLFFNIGGGNSLLPPPCEPVTTGHCCNMGIWNVSLNTINHASGSGTEGYMDFSDSIGTIVKAENTYAIDIQTGPGYDENVRVWIDYNNDGVFDHPDEMVFESLSTREFHSGTINIPDTAVKGTPLRMRVGSDYYSQPTPLPCEDVRYGQFEDYRVSIFESVAFDPDADTVAAGDSSVVDVTAKSCGLLTGKYMKKFYISSNDPLNSLDSIFVSLDVLGTSKIGVSEACLAMDTIMENHTAQDTFAVYNEGCDTLFVNDITNNLSAYSADTTNFVLLPGDSQFVTVTFSPTAAGDYYDTLVILNSDTTHTVCLHGYAYESPTLIAEPDSFNVTINSCCDSIIEQLSIHNAGGGDLEWQIGAGSMHRDNFDGGINGSLWSTNSGNADQTCGSVSGDALKFCGSTRLAETVGLDVLAGGSIDFYLKITRLSSGSGCSGCDEVDNNNETVHLEYSTDGGSSWTAIRQYDYASYDPWVFVSEPIPPAAQTPNTKFRWFQGSNFSNSFDHWAIDELKIGKLPFLTADPATDTTVAGDTSFVDIIFNSCGLESGSYEQRFFIFSNDPLQPVDTAHVQFTVNGSPQIVLSDDCLNMDTIMEHRTKKATLYIANDGCDTLTVGGISNNLSEFSIDTSNFTLLPGDSMPVTVTFAPVSVGSFYDTLTIFNNDQDTSVCLSGYAYPRPVMSTFPDTISAVINACDDTAWSAFHITNSGGSVLDHQLSGDVGYDSTSTQFYNDWRDSTIHVFENLGQSDSIILTIKMSGDYSADWEYAVLYIDGQFVDTIPDGNPPPGVETTVQYVFKGAQAQSWLSDRKMKVKLENSLVDPFVPDTMHQVRLQLPGLSWLQADTTAGKTAINDTTTHQVLFNSAGKPNGTHEGRIIVNGNDPLNPSDTIVTLLTVNGSTGLALSDACMDLDSIMVYTSNQATLQIFNPRCDTLFVTNLTTSTSIFSVDTNNLMVLPYDSQEVVITYSPTTTGAHYDTLDIINSFSDTTVCLSGKAYPRPILSTDPDSFDVTINSCCDSLTQPLKIYNTGGHDLDYNVVVDHAFSLDTILSRLNNDYTNINSIIPNRFDFSNGVTSYYISDGGNDMYDGGNMLYTDLGGPIFYSDNTVVSNSYLGTNGQYFTRKYPGLFIFAADVDSIDEFRIDGNLGADGSGNLDGTTLSTTYCGQNYTGFVKRVYNAGDPSVNHLIIVESDNNLTHDWPNNTDNDLHRLQNLLAASTGRVYYLLYAASGGDYIDDAETKDIMQAFLETAIHCKTGTVSVNDSAIVDVQFKSCDLGEGTHSQNLYIFSNDPLNTSDTIPYKLTVDGAPLLALSDTCLDLDTALVGNTNTDFFRVINNGCDTLMVSNITNTNPDFSANPTDFSVPPNAQAWVTVDFTPSAIGTFKDTLNLTTNNGDTLVCLEGVGLGNAVIVTEPDTFDITLACGQVDTQRLTIYNTGVNDLEFNINDTISWLALSNNSDTVTAGDSSLIDVAFNTAGLSTGQYSGTLIINSNDIGNPTVNIPVMLTVTSPLGKPGADDVSVCEGQPVPPFIASGLDIKWYSDATLTTLEATGDTFYSGDTSSGVYTYYATQTDTATGCESEDTAVTLTITSTSVAASGITASKDSVCLGDSTQLTVSGGSLGAGADWYWYADACGDVFVGTGSSVWVHPSSTSYHYYVRAEGLCDSTACVSDSIVVITTAPQVDATDTTVCEGAPTPPLIAVGTNVKWYSDPGLSMLVYSGDTFNTGLTAAGTYHYYVTQTIGGCTSIPDTATLVIESASTDPSGIAATEDTICSGNSTTLSVNGGALGTGATWQWYSGACGGTAEGSGTALAASPTATTTYYVRAEGVCDTTSCASIEIVVGATAPSPPAANDTSVCADEAVPALTATGSDIKWYSDAGMSDLVHTGSTFVTGHTDPGGYTYYVTQTVNGCESTVEEVKLTIHPTPFVTGFATPPSIAEGDTATLKAFNVVSYNWQPNVALSSTAGSQVYASPPSTQTYIVTGTDSTGCSDTAHVTVEVGLTGLIGNGSGSEIRVYPNPTLGSFTVDLHASQPQEQVKVQVLNTVGQIVDEQLAENIAEKYSATFNLDGRQGVYYLHIITRNETYYHKVVVQN